MYKYSKSYPIYPDKFDISFDELKQLIQPIMDRLNLTDDEVSNISVSVSAGNLAEIELDVVCYGSEDDKKPYYPHRLKYVYIHEHSVAVKIAEYDNTFELFLHNDAEIKVDGKKYYIQVINGVPKVSEIDETIRSKLNERYSVVDD